MYESRWTNQNEDHDELNDVSTVRYDGATLTLACNGHTDSRRATGAVAVNQVTVTGLQELAANPDDQDDFELWAEALGLALG